MAATHPTDEAKKETAWQAIAKPVVVLVVICALTGLALGGINTLTLPLITEGREARALATYSALVPEATSFTELTSESPGVTAFMEADGNNGMVVVAQARGYSGQVPVAVAFTPDGIIGNIATLPNTETPGLGTKISEESFIGQFRNRAPEPVAVADIDTITGATISSKAALNAVNAAIEAYNAGPSSTSDVAAAATDEKGAA